MTTARHARATKHRLGQYFTPAQLAEAIVRQAAPSREMRILEPSFGDGSFIFSLLQHIEPDSPDQWCSSHIDGCEIDGEVFKAFSANWESRFGCPPPSSLKCLDFFRLERPADFPGYDLIIGNPPFGGAFDPAIDSSLERCYGSRNGHKIKKETYAFFLVKSLEMLAPGGRLFFICSDTLLTISTMAGLRIFAESMGTVEIQHLPGAFEGTLQSMVLLQVTRAPKASPHISVFGQSIPRALLEATPNHSWLLRPSLAAYFTGKKLGDFMEATAGMTTGNNELFIREINGNGSVTEPYSFSMTQKPVRLQDAIANARNGRLSRTAAMRIAGEEAAGAVIDDILVKTRRKPVTIPLPSTDYAYYNKADKRIFYAPPAYVIFWRDNGKYVYTYKNNGKWYLHGVGGKRFFGRAGMTWQLISNRIRARILPPGYILDCGAPAAFLRPGIPEDVLYFIMGWCLTDLCTSLLKGVLNHTRNIQAKDFEKLPFPAWVDDARRKKAVSLVKSLTERARNGEEIVFNSPEMQQLEKLYARE